MSTHVADLSTPTVIIDRDGFDRNLATMAALVPGARLRPHVKAHKCTSIGAAQAAIGHHSFTCATPLEVLGMARTGLGADLLLANETVDRTRLRAIADLDVAVTVAVDSDATIRAAASGGIKRCLIDVTVGMPRCGVAPDQAGRLADAARALGLEVRGVMGYEGHLMMVADRSERSKSVDDSMRLLLQAHRDVGGDLISAGGTGTFDLHSDTGVNEVQAGSYALMDSHYAKQSLPFEQAVWVLGTVISVSSGWAVADVGLKALGMDHGNPTVDGATVWFCSDEHITFQSDVPVVVGDQIRVTPAHVDPTMAMHESAWVVRGDDVLDRWAIDLRGW